tara:strand:- start:10293 stop:10745 length:453 start_codon:yes stop_codon:yes gene_type:complete
MAVRNYTGRRQSIVNALVVKLKLIDGTGEYLSNVYKNVHPRLKFWDEVEEFPAIHLNAGSESREYQGGGFKDRYLSITVRIYINEEDSVEALDKLLEDVETSLEENSRLSYTDRRGVTQTTQQISIISITTDEGVLDPYGVGEILVEVRY